MIEQPNSAIARIFTIHGAIAGAGFLISERHLFTCAHVVAAALDVKSNVPEAPEGVITLDFPLVAPNEKRQARVVEWNPLHDKVPPTGTEDVAVLELTESAPSTVQAAIYIEPKNLQEHDWQAFGFPTGYDLGVWAHGKFGGPREGGWIQLDGSQDRPYSVAQGFSGGPIWDNQQQAIVGMVASVEKSRERRAAFMIPTTLLAQVSPALHIQEPKPLIDPSAMLFPANRPQTPPDPERPLLLILLNKVKTYWIENVLKKSLHHEVLLDLGKEGRPDAVDRPWEMVIELPNQDERVLPPKKKIIDIFEEVNRALLILGEPGSGKTITLLELARDLIVRAETDPTRPIPVVFNLSSWTLKQPLIDWLVEELLAKYQIPKKTSQLWLETYRLLPLFDGLDEVKRKNQAACVEAINKFGAEQGLTGLVICSRREEYLSQPLRLRLNAAISLQPLTLAQIDDYLATVGPDKLKALRTVIQNNTDWLKMAKSPLMLSVMSIAYQDVSRKDLERTSLDSLSAYQKDLFDRYIDRMFQRIARAKYEQYLKEKTIYQLRWLAQRMSRHNQAIFLIEQIQPSWLSSRKQRWLYVLTSRLAGGVSFGLLLALTLGLVDIVRVMLAEDTVDFLLLGWLAAVPFLAVLFGSMGLIYGLIDTIFFEINSKRIGPKNTFAPWQVIVSIFVFGLTFGVVFGVIGRLNYEDFTGGFLWGVIFGLVGVFFSLRGSKQSYTSDIQTVEPLSWSSAGVEKGMNLGRRGGEAVGQVVGQILTFAFYMILIYDIVFNYKVGTDHDSFLEFITSMDFFYEAVYTIASIILFSLFYCVFVVMHYSAFYNFTSRIFAIAGLILGGIFGGLNSPPVEKKTLPNEGITRSVKSALFGGVITGLFTGFIAALILGVTEGVEGSARGLDIIVVHNQVDIALWVGSFFGVIASLWYGGLGVIQHYTLRLILSRNGYLPWNLADFLDYATDRIFLRKVGGGYIFIHRMLMEHFAAMGEPEHTDGEA